MWKTVARRFLILIPQMFVMSIVIFILANMMPGDALSGLIDPTLSPEALQVQRELLGLDRPLHERYITWIRGIVFEFDFGNSFTHRRPVTELMAERIMNTLWLSIAILVMTYLIAIPLGILAGRYRGTPIDKGVLIYIMLAMSMPTMVLAIVSILFFAFWLGWFPPVGSVNPIILATGTPFEIFLNRVHHMILPTMVGAILGTMGTIYMLRANIIDRTYSDYVTLARSKGVPTGTIFRRHILRNSLIPITADFGFAIAFLITANVFIENIFVYPGIGNLFVTAINQRDFAVVNAIVILFAFAIVIGALISDILLTIVDPRIRIQ